MKLLQHPHVLLTFDKVHNPLRLPHETTSERPKVVRTPFVFYTFVCEMCFTPQRRALFRHRNFQKWSEAEVLCTVWLGHVLRAAPACNFSFLISPDGSAPAALASLLLGPQNHWQNRVNCNFLSFRAPASSFFWLFLLSDLSSLLFSSLTAFPSVHIVGSLTSKISTNMSNDYSLLSVSYLSYGNMDHLNRSLTEYEIFDGSWPNSYGPLPILKSVATPLN